MPKKDLENRLRSFFPLVETMLAKQIQWRLGVVFNQDDADRDIALTRDFFSPQEEVNIVSTKFSMTFTAVNRGLKDMLVIIGSQFLIVCRMRARDSTLLITPIFNRKKLCL